jgi:hypothetical protein
MPLGIGNNLIRNGGVLNPDGLSLNLQFAADKTLTARKGPTPVFTRGSTGTFVGSDGLIQTAAVDTPRFDHDPVTLASRGLLIEESRTNLLARSEELGNAYWTISNASISENNQTSPDGSLTADTITVSAGTPSLYRAVACTASTLYTFSFYIKIGTLTPSDFKFAVRDDTNGVFIAENIVPNITPVTTEWRRVTYTFTTPVGCVLVRPYLMRYSYLSAGTIYLWGAQLEAGSFPTSYIPTTTGSVVRSADVCSITGTPFSNMWNTAEGTMYVSGDKSMSTVTSGSYFSFQAGGTEVGPLMTRTSTQLLGRIRNNAGSDITNTDTSQSPSGEKKLAVAWVTSSDANTRDFSSGGVILTKSNPLAGTAANNQTTMIIGSRPSSAIFNGTISTIRYYRKRLSNDKLQSLTA